MPPQHVVAIIGGAVAGSEAALIAAERGALALVIEQNARPYGKIEDGLPRWHVALRDKEYAKIDENLAHPNILFVPRTRVGRDLAWETLTGPALGLSAVVLANGAWRDRPLPVAGVDRFVGRGLLYQNAFVYWFNHQLEPGYDGPRFEVPDGAIVVGGGLASIDVVKIINFELYGRALRARGIEVDAETMEHEGLPDLLARHGLTREALGVRGATLFYRRRAEDMPLVSVDEGSSAARAAKLEQTRVKLLQKVLDKYLVSFVPLAAPVRPIVVTDADGGERLGGLVFRKNEVRGKDLVALDEELEVRADLVVSSIGSIPEPLPGVPMKGELYVWRDWESGALDVDADVYGLGNVLTGKGNIVESRKSSKKVMTRLVEAHLGLRASDESGATVEAAHDAARAAVEPLIDKALSRPPLPPERVEAIKAFVAGRWGEIGYPGDYAGWMARQRD
ncbi:MAG: hypothetical protein IT385_00435 [Deltaproteobacteria bacterium]|nr:hypothetical protein [Deltaproteobacteria bacterium]